MADIGVYHIPVMLHEVLDDLAVRPDGIYLDGTAGGGGHSAAAGCTVKGSLEEAKNKLKAVAQEVL